MTATIHLTTEGDLDPDFCGSCQAIIGWCNVAEGREMAFVPYVLIPDCDDAEQLIGYDLDCAVRHCGVTIEVRG